MFANNLVLLLRQFNIECAVKVAVNKAHTLFVMFSIIARNEQTVK